jgi:hypothetical protein
MAAYGQKQPLGGGILARKQEAVSYLLVIRQLKFYIS